MVAHPYYNEDNHGPYEIVDIGALPLAGGGTLDPCCLAVATHGNLSEAKDNAILVPTWYSGSSKIIADVYIGEGRALDPKKYFIIVVNQIGNGLSTSPHAWNGGNEAFPAIDIQDDVEAQRRLLIEHFGITRLALVVGGSMGGQQALHWAIRHPDRVERAAAIAATAKPSDHLKVLLASMTDTLAPDGGTATALERHARFWATLGFSPAFYRERRYTALGFEAPEPFLDGFMNGYFAPMEVANLLCMSAKAARSDPARGGDPGEAFGRVGAKTLMMPIDTDMLFHVADVERECAQIPNGEMRVLTTTDGHLALFGTDPNFLAQVDANLSELLGEPVRERAP